MENGAFDDDHYRAARLGGGKERYGLPVLPFVPAVGEKEKARVERDQVRPEKRYHYRYLAADLAWQAATLMPDQKEETAAVLASAGLWLNSVGDSKGADRFYLALLRRCGKTDIGREADHLGGIPEVPHQSF